MSDDTSDEFGCGVDEAFDQRQGTGWSPFNPDSPRPDNPGTGDLNAAPLAPGQCGCEPLAVALKAELLQEFRRFLQTLTFRETLEFKDRQDILLHRQPAKH